MLGDCYDEPGVTWRRSSSVAGLSMIARFPSLLPLLASFLLVGVLIAGPVAVAQAQTSTSTIPTTTTTTDSSAPDGAEDDPLPYGLLTDQGPTLEPRVLGRQLLADEGRAATPPGPMQIVAGMWSDLPTWAKEVVGIPLVAVGMLTLIYLGLRLFLGVRDLLAMRQF